MVGRPCGAGGAASGDVGRAHRARDVDGEHDGRLLARHADARVRPRGAEDQGCERDEQDRERDVPARRARARTRFGISAGVGNARPRCARRRSLTENVERDETRGSRSARAAPEGAEAHRRLSGRRRARAASRRRWTGRVPYAECREARARRPSAPPRRPLRTAAGAGCCACRREVTAGLRVDEPELAHIRKLLLARVADLDCDHVVAAASSSSGSRQSSGPRKSETKTTSARWRARRRRAASASPSDVGADTARARAPRAAWRAGRAGPPGPGEAEAHRCRRRTSSTPSRFPRRVETCPIASATPSATSALRRSAVPKRIDGDVSSTSHVTSTRSASLTRTCGSPVRAVTSQSMRRTSSPATYGLICASSVPGAEQRRLVVAREQPLNAAADRDIERAQEAIRDRTGPGPLGERTASARARSSRRGRPRTSSWGTGTTARTRSRIESAVTSSASAWYESTSRCRSASAASAVTSST